MGIQAIRTIPNRKTRQEILGPSARPFARNGHGGVSMRNVAAAVGLTQAAPCCRFEDKDQLHLDAVACGFREREAALKDMLAGNGTPRRRLERFAAGFARMIAAADGEACRRGLPDKLIPTPGPAHAGLSTLSP